MEEGRQKKGSKDRKRSKRQARDDRQGAVKRQAMGCIKSGKGVKNTGKVPQEIQARGHKNQARR